MLRTTNVPLRYCVFLDAPYVHLRVLSAHRSLMYHLLQSYRLWTFVIQARRLAFNRWVAADIHIKLNSSASWASIQHSCGPKNQ